MVTNNEYFITQVKLRALREQRSRLLHAYNELRQRVSLEETEAGRLRRLYEGLRQVTFAGQKLHADVANLEPLLDQTDGEPISLETIGFWRERLEKELANGQLRSEIVYLFGAVLEEWASEERASISPTPELEQLQAALVERLLQPAETGNYAALLDTLLADLAFPAGEERSKAFQKAVDAHLPQRIQPAELAIILEQLSSSPYHSA